MDRANHPIAKIVERQNRIAARVQESGYMAVETLAREFGVAVTPPKNSASQKRNFLVI